MMKEIYGPLFLAETPFVITDVASAELIKYASNGFLAVKISFINEIAQLCELMGADVQAVARGMGLDHGSAPVPPARVRGSGGPASPRTPRPRPTWRARTGIGSDHRGDHRTSTSETKARMIEKIEAAAGPLAGRTAAVLGLSFKPETDDIRESPALSVIADLLAAGATVRAFDPAAMENTKAVFRDLYYAKDAYDCARARTFSSS